VINDGKVKTSGFRYIMILMRRWPSPVFLQP